MFALRDPELSEETLRSYITKAEEKLGLVLKDKQCELYATFPMVMMFLITSFFLHCSSLYVASFVCSFFSFRLLAVNRGSNCRLLNTFLRLVNSSLILDNFCQFCCTGFLCKDHQALFCPSQWQKKRIWPCETIIHTLNFKHAWFWMLITVSTITTLSSWDVAPNFTWSDYSHTPIAVIYTV